MFELNGRLVSVTGLTHSHVYALHADPGLFNDAARDATNADAALDFDAISESHGELAALRAWLTRYCLAHLACVGRHWTVHL